MKRRVTLELSPAEARALYSCLDNELWSLREHGVGADELPRYYARLERVQRLVADGLHYLRKPHPWLPGGAAAKAVIAASEL